MNDVIVISKEEMIDNLITLGLDKLVAEQACDNIGPIGYAILTTKSELVDWLCESFAWFDSREGSEYWDRVVVEHINTSYHSHMYLIRWGIGYDSCHNKLYSREFPTVYQLANVITNYGGHTLTDSESSISDSAHQFALYWLADENLELKIENADFENWFFYIEKIEELTSTSFTEK